MNGQNLPTYKKSKHRLIVAYLALHTLQIAGTLTWIYYEGSLQGLPYKLLQACTQSSGLFLGASTLIVCISAFKRSRFTGLLAIDFLISLVVVALVFPACI